MSKKELGIELDNRGYPVHRSTGGARFRRGLTLAADDDE